MRISDFEIWYPKFGNKTELGMDVREVSPGTRGETGTQIEYEDEDPEIRRLFEAETAKHGVTVDMPKV